MATNITIKEHAVVDFVSVDMEQGEVTLSLFHGRVQVGSPGWINQMRMSPEQAEAVGQALINVAKQLK